MRNQKSKGYQTGILSGSDLDRTNPNLLILESKTFIKNQLIKIIMVVVLKTCKFYCYSCKHEKTLYKTRILRNNNNRIVCMNCGCTTTGISTSYYDIFKSVSTMINKGVVK